MNIKELIEELREWKETPWIHQGRLKGVGADCIFSLHLAILKEGLPIHKDHQCINYGMLPFNQNLETAMRYYTTEVTGKIQPGDFILFTMVKEPQHIAIYTYNNQILHSDGKVGKVVEHNLDNKWINRIHYIGRLKEY